MYLTITKEFSFDIAHRLEGHEGLCNNVHGHTYKLFVSVRMKERKSETKDKSSKGMVYDFKNLKEIVKEVIVDKLDHGFVYNKDDLDSKSIAKVLEGQIKQKTYAFPFRTTAENMARWMFFSLNDYFNENEINLECHKIKLYETPTSYAEFSPQ